MSQLLSISESKHLATYQKQKSLTSAVGRVMKAWKHQPKVNANKRPLDLQTTPRHTDLQICHSFFAFPGLGTKSLSYPLFLFYYFYPHLFFMVPRQAWLKKESFIVKKLDFWWVHWIHSPATPAQLLVNTDNQAFMWKEITWRPEPDESRFLLGC